MGLPGGPWLAPLWEIGGRVLRLAALVTGAAVAAGYLLGRRR